jgi:hypothetical protein
MAAPAVRLETSSLALEVDRELAGLARARGPLRRGLAGVAGRIVATRAWERLGYPRLADWARERAGHSARSVRDLAHVDGVLARLPELERALVSGELTWTKVRLVARVATEEDAGRWVAYARTVTARALEREVRAIDLGAVEAGGLETDEDGAEEVEQECVRIVCTPGASQHWRTARQMARRMAGEELPVWACAEAVAAEVLSAIPMDADLVPEVPKPFAGPAALAVRSPRERERMRVRDRIAELQTARSSAAPANACAADDPWELDGKFGRWVRLEQGLEARMGPLLREVADGRMYRELGCRSFEEYARERLGMSPRRARGLLRIERVAGRCEVFAAAYRSGELSWVRAQALVSVAIALLNQRQTRHVREWVSWAVQVTVRRLEDDVDAALVLRDTDPDAFARTGGVPREAWTGKERSRPRQTRAGPTESATIVFCAPREVARLFRAVLCTVRRRLGGTEGEVFDAMVLHAIHEWERSSPLPRSRYRVYARDGWRCTAPGCSSRRNLHDHHIRFRSKGGSDELWNRTTLCAWHHLRGVHARVLRCRGSAPQGLRFDLGVRSEGPPLVAYVGDRVVRA